VIRARTETNYKFHKFGKVTRHLLIT